MRPKFIVMVYIQRLLVACGWRHAQIKLQLPQRCTWRSTYVNLETIATAMPRPCWFSWDLPIAVGAHSTVLTCLTLSC